MPELRGLITDWGGVLTNPIIDTVTPWLAADGIDPASYRAVMRNWVHGAYKGGAYDAEATANPVWALERGECSPAEFERQFAAELATTSGVPVEPEGLLARMFAATMHDQIMFDVVRGARQAGLKTALLSNSWGAFYPLELFGEMFDAVVISAEVGLRKPELEIFQLAADRIGLPPEQCVFIDDVEANITAARAAGLTGVRHRTASETAAQLSDLLGIVLPPPAG